MLEQKSTPTANDALIEKCKQLKLYYGITLFCLILCTCITIARIFMYGIGYFIFLPIFIGIIAIVIGKNYQSVKKEIATKHQN